MANDNTAGTQPATQQEAGKTVQVGAADRKPKKGMLWAKVYTPFKTYFEGDALSLSALNETGNFDILPGHRNFITMLKPCDVVVETPDKTKQTISIARGLMHVRQDQVIIFLDV